MNNIVSLAWFDRDVHVRNRLCTLYLSVYKREVSQYATHTIIHVSIHIYRSTTVQCASVRWMYCFAITFSSVFRSAVHPRSIDRSIVRSKHRIIKWNLSNDLKRSACSFVRVRKEQRFVCSNGISMASISFFSNFWTFLFTLSTKRRRGTSQR